MVPSAAGKTNLNINPMTVTGMPGLLRRLLFPVLLLLGIMHPLQAQRYHFTTYSIADGLPNNQIFSVIQDRNGLLWIGTAKGACRFDGMNFYTFEQDNALSQNPVRAIFEDSKGHIWLGMIRKGLCRFDGSRFTFFNMDNGLLSDIIYAINEDNKGRIWIGTRDGLNMYDGTKFHPYTDLGGLASNTVYDIKADGDHLWISTLGGISRFNGKSFRNFGIDEGLTHNISYVSVLSGNEVWAGTYDGISVISGDSVTNRNPSYGLANTRVQHMSRDRKGRVWVCTFGRGVVTLDADTVTNSFTTDDGLASNHVFTSQLDREGNFWFGTDKGLSRYSGNRFETYTTDDGLTNNYILTVFTDSSGCTWFGTLAGGISCFDKNGFSSLPFADELKNSTIWSITQDKQGRLWLGTTSGAALMDLTDSTLTFPFTYLKSGVVHKVLVTKTDNIYFATDNGVFTRKGVVLDQIGVDDGLFEEKARVLYEDRDGTIWIGTMRGLFYLDGDSARSFNNEHGLPLAPVTSIIQDGAGNLVVSTYDFGLILYYKDEGRVRELNKTSGLNNNRLLFAHLDRNRTLWLGTPEGLDAVHWDYFLESGQVNISHLGKSNGFFGTEANAASNEKTGDVWFGTVNGAIRYRLDEGIGRQQFPLVNLNNIQLFLNDVDWSDIADNVDRRTGLPLNPVLEYNQNYLSFFFSGIYLTAPEEVTYRFMLEGFDKTWSPVTKQSVANYSNVPPGEYTFKVQATANLKDWSAPDMFAFTITPPVWKTPAFYILYILIAAGFIVLFIQVRTRKLRMSQLMLRKKVEMRTTELNEKNIELEKLSLVASETDNAVMIFDEKKELEWVNVGFEKQTGYSLREVKAGLGNTIYDISSNPVIRDIITECIRGKSSATYESVFDTKQGKSIWLSSTLNPIFNDEGKLMNLVVVDTDISYRKEMEEQIKESLEEKGLLLKEIHHRVKNNLQIIISLFNLQSGYVDDDKAYKALREGQDRIKSMALIHERFYQADGTTRIDFDDYIRRLCESLLASADGLQERVRMKFELQKISLDIDSAVPCGLIINELVNNSIKHAFPGKRTGSIFVSFSRDADRKHRLVIEDDGIGLPAGFDLLKADTLGMQLVTALTDQLEGTVRNEPAKGSRFVIEFVKA